VTIDPTTTLYRSADVMVRSDLTTNQMGAVMLETGSFARAGGGVGHARTAISFDVAPVAGARVLAADFHAYSYYSGSCAALPIGLHRITAAWNAATITWASQPGYVSSPLSSAPGGKGYNATCPEGYLHWADEGFRSLVQQWADGTTANHGVVMRSGVEGDTRSYTRFHSADYGGVRVPRIAVTYNTPPGAVSDPRPSAGTEVGPTPTLRGRFHDADAGTGRVDFEVRAEATGALVAAGSGTTVGAGYESSWTVPAGALADGGAYRWRARGHDGALAGAWSAEMRFAVAAAAIVGEQRRFSFTDELTLTDRLAARVNVANGNLLLAATDLRIRGTGLDAEWTRYYNSRAPAVGPLGRGWVAGTGADVRLREHPDGAVSYHAPSGFTARFARTATGWARPPGVAATLTRDAASGAWTLRFDRGEGRYLFAASGQLSRIADRNGNELRLAYTAGRLTTLTDTQGRELSFDYAGERLAAVTDAAGRVVRYGYDPGGTLLVSVTDAAGGITRFGYTAGLLTSITTPAGRRVEVGYLADGSARVASLTRRDAGGDATTALAYEPALTRVTDPNGSATRYLWEDRDRVTRVIDAAGHERRTGYTPADDVTTQTDALANTTTMSYDPNTANLTSVGLPTGARSTLSYTDPAHPHAVTQVTDPQGNRTGAVYDGAGNPTTTTAAAYPGQALAQRSYHPDGTVAAVVDGNGTRTGYSYDGRGNLTGVDRPDPLGDVTITPDELSRPVSVRDGNGRLTRYAYDAADRIDTVTYADGAVVDHDHDADGHLVRVSDPSGVTTLEHDGLGRLIARTTPGAGTLRLGYDRVGNLVSLSDPALGETRYAYNAENLLVELTEPGAGAPVRFRYDENHRRRFVDLPTVPAATVEVSYDRSGRVTRVHTTRSGTVVNTVSYSYARAGADTGLRQAMTDAAGTTTYSYDGLNRLIGAAGALSRSYAYDIDFNRTAKTENGVASSYAHNAANQLTAAGATTYSYDGQGNLTGSSSGWALGYNRAHQTTAITAPGGVALDPITYAGTGQAERRRAGATRYLTGPTGVIGETTGGTTIGYVRDSEGNLISRRAGGRSHYYLLDGLGSVVGLLDETGVKVNSYHYDPYGVTIFAVEAVPNPWCYASGYTDPTGLVKFGERYYDPALGRFTQPDPSGRDLPYGYAGCDPVNHTDPSGALSLPLCIRAGALAAAFSWIGATAFLEGFTFAVESAAGAYALAGTFGLGVAVVSAVVFLVVGAALIAFGSYAATHQC
jgi:RHS repeat-associated protein